MDSLFSELSSQQGDGWMRAQSDIERIWSRSGSAALDLLLMRGEAALDAGDVPAAIGHLTALTENAPDFAVGWAARAVAFYLAGETGPAMADLAQALRLEPRHWPSVTLLATILEDMGQTDRALDAYRESLAINPHQDEAEDGVARLMAADQGQDV
ncbi:tetratricopeptide repeat protein [Paracoccus niistensis]|uniref:Tetratricopeptide repeat protein n=1 Tax=Paracoccus niistensis TaxID=632935 RepID=A0ABV6I1U8_9RHOB